MGFRKEFRREKINFFEKNDFSIFCSQIIPNDYFIMKKKFGEVEEVFSALTKRRGPQKLQKLEKPLETTDRPKMVCFYSYSACEKNLGPMPYDRLHAIVDENFLRCLFFKPSRF